jgi:hypothetical protein
MRPRSSNFSIPLRQRAANLECIRWGTALVLGALLVPTPVHAADIEFITQELPWAAVDRPYSPPPLQTRSSGACTSGGVGYTVVSGSLPPGVSLSSLGYFSGTPLRTGSWEFAVRVSNGCTWTARHFVLVVSGAPILTVEPRSVTFATGQTLLQTLRVAATWPKLGYTVTSSAGWLKADPDHGFTPRQGSALAFDSVRLRVEPAGLKPGRYFATLTFTAWQALEAPVVSVELVIPEEGSDPAPVRTETH